MLNALLGEPYISEDLFDFLDLPKKQPFSIKNGSSAKILVTVICNLIDRKSPCGAILKLKETQTLSTKKDFIQFMHNNFESCEKEVLWSIYKLKIPDGSKWHNHRHIFNRHSLEEHLKRIDYPEYLYNRDLARLFIRRQEMKELNRNLKC